MISDELKALLIEVITSWQVIGVTVVLLLYFSLVFYVARFHQRREVSMALKKSPKPKKPKKEKKAPPESEGEEAEGDDTKEE